MGQGPVFEHPPWVSVFVDDATESIPGYIRIREAGGSPGAVVLAFRDGELALVHVYRRPLSRWMWELPRGFTEPGESSAEAASRELREETGLTVRDGQLESLGAVAPNSGILESEVDLYFVHIESPKCSLRPADPEEVCRAEWVSVPAVFDMVRDGTIVDGFTIAALARALLRGLIARGESG